MSEALYLLFATWLFLFVGYFVVATKQKLQLNDRRQLAAHFLVIGVVVGIGITAITALLANMPAD